MYEFNGYIYCHTTLTISDPRKLLYERMRTDMSLNGPT